MGKPGVLQSMGLQRVGHDLATKQQLSALIVYSLLLESSIPWGEGNGTPWTEEPGGLPSMGSHRVGHDWSDLAAAVAAAAVFHGKEMLQFIYPFIC